MENQAQSEVSQQSPIPYPSAPTHSRHIPTFILISILFVGAIFSGVYFATHHVVPGSGQIGVLPIPDATSTAGNLLVLVQDSLAEELKNELAVYGADVKGELNWNLTIKEVSPQDDIFF